MSLLFKTKAETLEMLQQYVKECEILPQHRFTVDAWETNSEEILGEINAKFSDVLLIVRSSSMHEDTDKKSLAGHFVSVLNVLGDKQLVSAIEKVKGSFADNAPGNQIFVQPMLEDVLLSGVCFSKEPSTGGHYYIISYDDHSGKTDTVTSGTQNNLKTFYVDKTQGKTANHILDRIIRMIKELEKLFNKDNLDVEFAIGKNEQLYLLQVRPLIVLEKGIALGEHSRTLLQIRTKLKSLFIKHPYLHGDQAIFGIMPDWNPAEIVGIRPKQLALSLYKEIITDNIWAYQRDNYGYLNLRSFPLLISFGGLPYIDVRVSFNSFIPSILENEIAEKLTNYYINKLKEYPNFHDKVEFEVLLSCYTLDIDRRLEKLQADGFLESECKTIASCLRKLTNNIINNNTGLWKSDIKKINKLEHRINDIKNSELDLVSKIYWLLEDCKRYGTLPFAGLARAGFIAVQLLKSLVINEIITQNEYDLFMGSLNTVSSAMSYDFNMLQKDAFLKKYGHLRPGTYDITSPCYIDKPELYFNWDNKEHSKKEERQNFALTLKQMTKLSNNLREHRLEHDVLSFFNFLKSAIEGREYAKFEFTKALSYAMELLADYAGGLGISREDIAYADISIIKELYGSSINHESLIRESILKGKNKYKTTKSISLPPLITKEEDVYCFELPTDEPNYITLNKITGKVVFEDDKQTLTGNVLFIKNADPGYDWIFSHKIGGFITMFGGANSHMAIRAGELGIPAAVGAGEKLYNMWKTGKIIELDCINRKVTVLQ